MRPRDSRSTVVLIAASVAGSRADVRLVEQQHRGVPQHGPGDGDALPLTARPPAQLAHRRVVALWQGGDDLVDLGGLGGGAHLLVGGVELADRNVVAHRPGKQEALLEHGGHLGVQRCLCDRAEVDTSGRDPTALGIVEAQQELQHCALPGPAGPDERNPLARQHLQVHVLEHGLLGNIAEADVLELQGALESG